MSAEVIKSWRAIPNLLELLTAAKNAVPEKRQPRVEHMQLVGLHLCVAMRGGRDYVDETHAQLSAELVTLSNGQLSAALSALDHPLLWPIVKRGNKNSGTQRRPAFMELTGANPSEIDARTHRGNDVNSVGLTSQLTGVTGELTGANPTTPKESPKPFLNDSPKARAHAQLAALVAPIALRMEGEKMKPLQTERLRKTRQNEYQQLALAYLQQNDCETGDTFPVDALARYLVSHKHYRIKPDTYAHKLLNDWNDYQQAAVDHDDNAAQCPDCFGTGQRVNPDDFSSTPCVHNDDRNEQ